MSRKRCLYNCSPHRRDYWCRQYPARYGNKHFGLKIEIEVGVKSYIFSQIFIVQVLIGHRETPIRIVITPFPSVKTIGLSVKTDYKTGGMTGDQVVDIRIVL